MRLSIVHITTREDGKFAWFVSSLVRELASLGPARPEFDVVVVDTKLWYLDEQARRAEFRDVVAGRFDFQHVPPKPSVWQGPTRLTQFDFFCAASARNTALCYARGDHVAFVDDLAVCLPGWASGHLHAAQHGYVMCGSTCKNKEMVVDEQGFVTSHKVFPPGQDHRLKTAQRDGSIRCSGSWLFGGTFSVPLRAAIEVNGQDEIHDTIGGEDYCFGIRLERAGYPIYFNRTCATMESEEAHHVESPMARIDKPVPVHGPYSSNLLYHRLMATTSTWTQSNRYVLRELRERVQHGEPFPVPTEPTRHWVDEQPLARIKNTVDGLDDLERQGVREW